MNEVDDGAKAIAGGVVSRKDESPHQSTSSDLDESQGERKPHPALGRRQFAENDVTPAVLTFSTLQTLRALNDDDGGKNDDMTAMHSLPSQSSYSSSWIYTEMNPTIHKRAKTAFTTRRDNKTIVNH